MVKSRVRSHKFSAVLVVSGWGVGVEVSRFLSIIQMDYDEPKFTSTSTSHWQMDLSLCDWLLKVVGAPGHRLAANDKPELLQLRDKFAADDDCAVLRRFVQNGAPMGVKLSLLAAHFEAIMLGILAVADFVCTTPHMSQDTAYKHFADSADAVVLDDAGALCKADAIQVWGPQLRPCAMAGDVKKQQQQQQRPAAVVDRQRNMLFDEGGVSVLDFFQQTTHPTFVLN